MSSRGLVSYLTWVACAVSPTIVSSSAAASQRSVRFIRSVSDSERPIELSEISANSIPASGASLSDLATPAPTAAAATADLAAGNTSSNSTPTAAPPLDSYDRWMKCLDAGPNETGFNVWTLEGILGPASCTDLATKCHSWVNSSGVMAMCPAACFLCDPKAKKVANGPPCYDSVVTGVRFKQGPQATCKDLAHYCQHSTLYYHVQAACRKTCGLCEAHVGHVAGSCNDLEPHEEPEFRVAGQLAKCEDLVDFCGGGLGSAYLIRHKCPMTCGMCPIITTSTHSSYTTSNEASFNGESEPSDCERRRRWGFCSSRRRRNM